MSKHACQLLLPHHASLPACLPACRIQLLEISQYLEHYLWPHFEAAMAGAGAAAGGGGVPYEHLMSMVVMVNQKFREQVPGWTCFQQQNKVRRLAGWLARQLAAWSC